MDGEPGVSHLAYEVDDVESLRARLKAAGFRESTVPNAHPHRKRVYFYDPDGIRLEFFCNTTATTAEGLAVMRTPGRKNRELILDDVPAEPARPEAVRCPLGVLDGLSEQDFCCVVLAMPSRSSDHASQTAPAAAAGLGHTRGRAIRGG